jgi:hypothetical protein
MQAATNQVESTDASVTSVLQQMQEAGCAMTCQQMEQLIASLQQQAGNVEQVSAKVDAGGKPVPEMDPSWAPWPAHSWPSASTKQAQLISKTVNQVQSTDSTEIDDIWSEMRVAGC